jgi:hypothetical protein
MARKRSGTEETKDETVVTVSRPEYADSAQLTLRQAAAYVGVKPGRIRKLMQGENPRINGKHEEIEGTGIKVWRVPFSEIKDLATEMDSDKAAGKSTRRTGTRQARADGKQYVIRLTQEQFAVVRPFLEEQKVELESRYQSRENRKAKKAAALANGAAPEATAEPVADDETEVVEEEGEVVE